MPNSRRALTGSPVPTVRILIADDDLSIRRLLDAALPQLGFSVCLATSGSAAIALYARGRAAIDVVLLDVHMPGALDCFETLAALRKLNPAVRCCFMSTHADAQTVAGLLDGGALAVVGKPFRLGELAEGLRELAGKDSADNARPTTLPAALSCPAAPAAV